jgi:hypothetical protein
VEEEFLIDKKYIVATGTHYTTPDVRNNENFNNRNTAVYLRKLE